MSESEPKSNNTVFISFGLIFMIITVGSLLGKFFDIPSHYYVPFLIWGIALCIFNLFLEKDHKNIFLKKP